MSANFKKNLMGVLTLYLDVPFTSAALNEGLIICNFPALTLPDKVRSSYCNLKSVATLFNGCNHGCWNASLKCRLFNERHVHSVRRLTNGATINMDGAIDLRWDGLSQRVQADVHIPIGCWHTQNSQTEDFVLTFTRNKLSGDFSFRPLIDYAESPIALFPVQIQLTLEYDSTLIE